MEGEGEDQRLELILGSAALLVPVGRLPDLQGLCSPLKEDVELFPWSLVSSVVGVLCVAVMYISLLQDLSL